MGAWIEINRSSCCNRSSWSHPTWVRGLKYLGQARSISGSGSHPTWVRGLKCQIGRLKVSDGKVAPHMGAWIEICFPNTRTRIWERRTPHGCVD